MNLTGFRYWLKTKARPWATTIFTEWWDDIAEKPRPHFVSMVFGIAMYLVVSFVAWAML